ncbi:MAG: tripartite tricarboxylate transporter substrate binding protein [Alphaproteobacteria bacterium]|nr:MAG: tripartite tricarboxylate transporter substrate binding protein [Alphaproteobacteria bacterium]
MTFFPRVMRAIALGTCMIAGVSAQASAAGYPEKPVQIIVPFGAGDALDGTARVIADRLKSALGVPFIVKNIPGAGGGKGTAEANKASHDGYTLLMGSTGALTARPLIKDPGYKTDDFVPIAQLVEAPIGLAVAADSPYKSVKDIVEAAKKSPGSVKYATPGPGSTQHINMEIFAKDEGIKLTHIGGRGGKGAVVKAMSGEVDFVFVGASNYTSLAKAGKLRVLGVAAKDRLPFLPDVPTFKEQGYDFNVAVWFGLLTNKGAPDEVVEKLRKVVAEIANTDKTRELYKKFNLNEAFLDGPDFQKEIDANVAKHGEVLKEIGLIK